MSEKVKDQGGTLDIDLVAMSARFLEAARNLAMKNGVKLNQKEFAERSHVTQDTLSRIELIQLAKPPSLENLSLIAFAAGKKFVIEKAGTAVFEISRVNSRSALRVQIRQRTIDFIAAARHLTGQSLPDFAAAVKIPEALLGNLALTGAINLDKKEFISLETIVKILGGDVKAIRLGLGD